MLRALAHHLPTFMPVARTMASSAAFRRKKKEKHNTAERSSHLAGKVVAITSGNFQQFVLNHEVPVLLECFSRHNKSCTQLSRNIKTALVETKVPVLWARVDIDENPDLIQSDLLSVRAVPFVKTYTIGQCVGGFFGLADPPELSEILTNLHELAALPQKDLPVWNDQDAGAELVAILQDMQESGELTTQMMNESTRHQGTDLDGPPPDVRDNRGGDSASITMEEFKKMVESGKIKPRNIRIDEETLCSMREEFGQEAVDALQESITPPESGEFDDEDEWEALDEDNSSVAGGRMQTQRTRVNQRFLSKMKIGRSS